MAITVLVNAGPWLRVPPAGYGGIENVLGTLIPELRSRGTRVWLCAVAGSEIEVDRLIPTLAEPMFEHISGPYNQMMGIAHAHMGAVVEAIESARGEIDVVHDHLEVVGPSVLAAMGHTAPPVLQTLHWDLAKHPDFYGSFDGRGRVFFNAVSEPQLATAPPNLRALALGAVPLATKTEEMPFRADKDGTFLVLARITPAKGQALAARLCAERGWRCDLAGPVGPFPGPAELASGLADPRSPLQRHADVVYWREEVEPYVDGRNVRWVGSLTGPPKLDLLGRARALLCPIAWDEPGATNVVEALACGTPVVGLRRGALPSLIEHGVTGFLADDAAELAGYMARTGEIDPHACRRSAEERFSAGRMAESYLALYGEVMRRADRPARPAAPDAAARQGRAAV